jgi:class 3 adenylate cyclase/tetratricopeptide (TPR) repeat protein
VAPVATWTKVATAGPVGPDRLLAGRSPTEVIALPGQTLDGSGVLRPYLPRLLLQWISDAPGTTLREIDGTMVFVDISGFTKMSERLAKRGKVGAEEVTDVLGSVFGRLLAVAYAEGGGLLKFGGDALLLFFSAGGHAAKGARAAFGMRAMLRQIGAAETSAGKITLRMSVGVHTGTFHFFLVGASHRELLLTGPAITETVSMEGTASVGEILMSRATASLLPHAVSGQAKGEGVLMRRAAPGLTIEAATGEPLVEGVDLLGCIPVALREHLLSGQADPEHRTATIAFVHFDGIDRLLRDAGPEVVAFGLDALVSEVQAAAEKHGVTFLGTDIDVDGGKIILVAGVPQALGDDEERMLLTLRTIIEAEPFIPVRVGVNEGHVFAGDIGPAYRRTYTVMGDAVNLAARVMAKAEPGQLLGTAHILDASSVAFNTLALEPFLVKGKAQPVRAFAIGDPLGSKPTEADDDLPLVGRDPEIGALRAALGQVHRGSGTLIEIVGDPGIGKTRLVNELRTMAADLPQLVGGCERYEAATSYLPFRRLFRLMLGATDTDERGVADRLRERVQEKAPHLAPWLPLLGIVADVDVPMTPEVELLGEEFRKERLEEITGAFLALVLTEPLVIVLEDVHWMDEGSSGLLRHLGRSIEFLPWLVCVTRRDEPTGFTAPAGDASMSVRPEPLPVESLREMIHAATEDAPLRPHVAEALAQRSGGNPLFLRELLRSAEALQDVSELPSTVEGVVTAKIDRLPAADRRLLRYAAVLGMSFSDDLVAGVLATEAEAPDPGAWRRLEEFIADEGLGLRRFRHGLIRDAAYEGLPYKRRRELHARIGYYILKTSDAGDDRAELLAMHFYQGQRFDEAWTYSRLAGDRARSKFAIVEAADFYVRALEAAGRTGLVPEAELARVWETVGDLRERIGQYDEAEGAYRAARRIVRGDPVLEAGLFLKQAWIPDRSGRYSEALRWLSRGLRALDGLDTDEAGRQRAKLLCFYGVVRQAQGRHDDAIRWLHRAIEEAERFGERDTLAHAYFILDWALIESGRQRAPVHSDRALAIYTELGDLGRQASIWGNSGIFAQWSGRWDEALDLLGKAKEAKNKLGDVVDAALAVSNIGEIHSDRGYLPEAERMFKDALRVHRSADFLMGVGFAISNLGRIASRSGRLDEADELYEEARSVFGAVGIESEVLETDARRAELLVMRERAEEALGLANEALQRLRAQGGALQEPSLERMRGYALAQLGRADEASVAFERSAAAARERDAVYEVALTLDAIARLRASRGAEPDDEDERRALVERLGLIAVPAVPLGRRSATPAS